MGFYVSWSCDGFPIVTKVSFGRDSKWFPSREEAEDAISEWYRDHPDWMGTDIDE